MPHAPRPFLPVRRRLLAAAALSPLALPGTGWAQSAGWPSKPVVWVVPFPAGGGTDAFARPLAAQLGRQLGQQVVIDNKGGAGGNVGAALAARAAPDGHTWFMGAVHHAIAPAMYPKLDYQLQADFVPVALLASVPQVVVVPARSSATRLADLLATARARPGLLNYGSAGNGTSHHLAGELFKLQTRTFVTHIPYRGAGPALQDLMAGQVDVMFDGLGSSAAHIRSGRLRGLAVASERRNPGFPDIPTAAESGVSGYQVATWYGLWAPKGTPAEAIERMQAELQKAFAVREIRETWTMLGSDVPTLTGRAFGDFVSGEIRRWADVARASGAKLD
ncbi:MAG: hypothetical protein RL456_2274 [Pseudomonadota bacterium]|jgi:tripartite-type tricarboxylate transporter receptor subunit TctC